MSKAENQTSPQASLWLVSLVAEFRRQLPILRRLSLRVILPIVILYAIVAFQPFVPFAVLLRDANATPINPRSGVTFYYGALSNLGILLWWAASVLYGFTAYLLHRRKSEVGPQRSLFAYFAAFTGLLALDDMFMIHEEVLPVLLGVPEPFMYALYGGLSAGFVLFTRILLDMDFLVLLLALGFFALSIMTDLLGGPTFTGIGLLTEDLSKMLGIVCWLIFAVRTCRHFLIGRVG